MWEAELEAAQELLVGYTGPKSIWITGSLAECAMWRYFFHETDASLRGLKDSLKVLERVLSETEKENDMSEGWWLTSAVTSAVTLSFSKKKKPVTDEDQQRFNRYSDALVGYGYYYFVCSFLMIKDNQILAGIIQRP